MEYIDEPPETEHWYINDSEVSEGEFLSLWKQSKYDMDVNNIIMFSRIDSDVSHFQLLKKYGSIAMDYDETISFVEK